MVKQKDKLPEIPDLSKDLRPMTIEEFILHYLSTKRKASVIEMFKSYYSHFAKGKYTSFRVNVSIMHKSGRIVLVSRERDKNPKENPNDKVYRFGKHFYGLP
jgi:hypothetical protein